MLGVVVLYWESGDIAVTNPERVTNTRMISQAGNKFEFSRVLEFSWAAQFLRRFL